MTHPLSYRIEMLRAGTREAHRQIETVPALVRLLASDLTKREYVAVLRHLEAFHAYLEPAIAARLKGMPTIVALLDGQRPRALAEDLAFFGAGLLNAPLLPALEGPASALGALYVLEGASLCGCADGRLVAKTLHVGPGTGGSFFGSQDAEVTRARWHHFCIVLGAAPLVARDADDRILSGARTTFDALEQWLRTADVGTSLAEA